MNSNEIELSNIHKIMSKRMKQSWTDIPQYQLSAEVDVTELYNMRNSIEDSKPSYTAIFTKLIAESLKDHLLLNSSWKEDYIIKYEDINIGIAMDTPKGLIVPVIKNAQNKSISEINKELRDLKNETKNGFVSPEKLKDGTFTISNLGMYRVSSFNAMINPPQAAILAFPKIINKTILDKENTLKSKKILKPTLTVDHRIADGATAARFLTQFVESLESPISIFSK